jgi:meso-butanediol dehydrogenase/(S,S)-butanediol dehydrogenase/diacetyl reductase
MSSRFAGRVAIVTGGASGIGAATARGLAGEGARVVIVDADAGGGAAVAAEIGGIARVADVADADDDERLVADTVRAHGGLDVLVQCAFSAAFGAIGSLGLAEWSRTLDVTLTAAFTMLRAAIPAMRARGIGAVVNVASVSGVRADRGLAAYNAAKAGLINLTRTAALELVGSGIRVNAVCPGLIDTPALQRAFARWPARAAVARAAVPAGRFGRPDEVARAILFLASEEASYVTGTTLVVDGGLSAGTGIPDLVPGA